jgi:hypothetical protein
LRSAFLMYHHHLHRLGHAWPVSSSLRVVLMYGITSIKVISLFLRVTP